VEHYNAYLNREKERGKERKRERERERERENNKKRKRDGITYLFHAFHFGQHKIRRIALLHILCPYFA